MEQFLRSFSTHLEQGQARALLSGGVVFSWLATGKQTGGQFSLFEARGIPGMEPPPHHHTCEDESFYILDGELLFTIGGKEVLAGPGDYIFMPRNITHQFKVLSASFHCLCCISPAGLEDYFEPLSQLHEGPGIPPVNHSPPSAAVIEFMKDLDKKFGITYYESV